MKKIFYILMFLFPIVVSAQQSWYKSSPLDYMWMNVGKAGFSVGEIAYTSLAFNPVNSQPYIAYSDSANSEKATVMKFDGTNWVNVGNADFSAGRADCTSLAFSPSGEPYVAYQDWANSYKATVKKFDGTNWVNVGNTGFSAGGTVYESLAFSPSDGEPYVAYSDGGYSFNATVMKFDGTIWVYVGNAGFSAGWVDNPELAFSPSDGQPYLAYMDAGNSYKTTLMTFNGNSWVNVGNAGFSAEETDNTSLAFSPAGQPYVAYNDYQFSPAGKATVMKYDSVSVGINELQQSKFSLYPNPSTDKITIETSTTPIKSQLSMMNLNGQEVLTRQITESKTQIDISNLPSGVYFVRLTNDKTVEVGKFVKE